MNLSKISYLEIIICITIGSIFCLSGLIVLILSLSGFINWFFESENIISKLINAIPGFFFIVFGMLLIFKCISLLKLESLNKSENNRISNYELNSRNNVTANYDSDKFQPPNDRTYIYRDVCDQTVLRVSRRSNNEF